MCPEKRTPCSPSLLISKVQYYFVCSYLFIKIRYLVITDLCACVREIVAGYNRRNIKIDINEDGSLIGISGEKQVQETVMVGWKMYKKEREIKGFKKVYRIPKGVILDMIEARFNDDESNLTITMPKKVKGISGTAIEEVKDKPELVRTGSGSLQISDEKRTDEKLKARTKDEAADKIPTNGAEEKPDEAKYEEKPLSLHDLKGRGKREPSIPGKADTCKEDEEKHDDKDDMQETTEPKQHEEKDEETYKQDLDKQSEEDKVGPSAVEEASEAEPGKVEEDERSQGFKVCMPLVAGSTLLLTFVVFVIQMIRSKHQSSRRRD